MLKLRRVTWIGCAIAGLIAAPVTAMAQEPPPEPIATCTTDDEEWEINSMPPVVESCSGKTCTTFAQQFDSLAGENAAHVVWCFPEYIEGGDGQQVVVAGVGGLQPNSQFGPQVGDLGDNVSGFCASRILQGVRGNPDTDTISVSVLGEVVPVPNDCWVQSNAKGAQKFTGCQCVGPAKFAIDPRTSVQAVRCIDKDACRLCLEMQPDGSLTPLLPDPNDPNGDGTNIGVEGGTCPQGKLVSTESTLQVELPGEEGTIDIEFTSLIGEPETFGGGSCPILKINPDGSLSGYCTCLGVFDDSFTSATFGLFVQRDPVTPTLCSCSDVATNPASCASNFFQPGCLPDRPVCPR
jgi:hypothetical protein